MAAAYHASSTWREKLEQLDQPNVNDVRETLTKDGHPLLLSVYVPLTAETGKDNQVHFAEFGSPNPEIDFVLEFTAEQIARLKQQIIADAHAEFAVIAAIKSVEQSDDSEDSDFVAKGRCLDFLVVNY